MSMIKFRNIISGIVAVLTFIVIPFYFDFSDFSWDNNSLNYIGFLTGILLLVANIGANYEFLRKK